MSRISLMYILAIAGISARAATLTITIPDDKVTAVVAWQKYTHPGVATNTATAAATLREDIIAWIKAGEASYRMELAVAAARTNVMAITADPELAE